MYKRRVHDAASTARSRLLSCVSAGCRRAGATAQTNRAPNSRGPAGRRQGLHHVLRAVPRAGRQRRHGASAGAPSPEAGGRRGRDHRHRHRRHTGDRDDGWLVALRARDHAGHRLCPLAGATTRGRAARRPGSRSHGLRPRGLRHLPHRRRRGLRSRTGSHRCRPPARCRRCCASRCSIPVPRGPNGPCRTSRMATPPTWSCVRSHAARAEVVGVRVNEDSFTRAAARSTGSPALVPQGRPAVPAGRARDRA